ncbi:uncharacterized protein LOC132259847 [Phlebotomus argentipes]|uniref:uncharacterized protein LOC132259847 n=1 Tax=Phlebotomus argentipes TaxID=94469 RepID=UPI002892F8C5|nr:uncharacterized protein LOC132259847 [Phlebotomus argentipes]
MVKLIELCKGMPNSNLIVKTHGNDFQLIGCFYGPNLTLQVSYDDSIHDFNEIVELAYASMVICQASPGFLHYSYHQALSLSSPFTYIHSICTPHRLFGCIPLSYRQSQPWQTKGKYTDCTVLLALVDKYTRTNFNYPSAMLRLPAVVQPLEDAQNWKHFYDVKLLTLKNNYRTSEICFGVDMNNVA